MNLGGDVLEKLVVEGGHPLIGSLAVHGSKNAALPIMAAALLAKGKQRIDHVPDLSDIRVMNAILSSLGCSAKRVGDNIWLDTENLSSYHVPERWMRMMRSSIFLMGPLLSRFGEVLLYPPGGCAIGERKIDLHLKGLQAMGVTIEGQSQLIRCTATKLVGAEISLDYPSVGATENLMMAAATAEGRTVLSNAAREPEIIDLQHFLNAMGARIVGAGTDTIAIEGVQELHPAQPYRIIPDRIVAGTMMMAAALTRGNVSLTGVRADHLTAVSHLLKRIGVEITVQGDIMNVLCIRRLRSLDRLTTSPYPAFPTDLQSQAMVLLATSEGISVVKETVFEGRFKHVGELTRMGADIRVDLNIAIVRGVARLYGATVEATDLRAGAALVLAGLGATGTTVIEHADHIDRGYEGIEHMLTKLGARIRRVSDEQRVLSPRR